MPYEKTQNMNHQQRAAKASSLQGLLADPRDASNHPLKTPESAKKDASSERTLGNQAQALAVCSEQLRRHGLESIVPGSPEAARRYLGRVMIVTLTRYALEMRRPYGVRAKPSAQRVTDTILVRLFFRTLYDVFLEDPALDAIRSLGLERQKEVAERIAQQLTEAEETSDDGLWIDALRWKPWDPASTRADPTDALACFGLLARQIKAQDEGIAEANSRVQEVVRSSLR